MKFFGQYLVEKSLLSEETLVDALIEQLRSMPSLAEVVYDLKVFSTKQFLNVLALQAQTGMEFKKTAESIGLWTKEVDEKVTRALGDRRIPLGQILVRTGKIGFEDITKALDEYLSSMESSVSTSEPAAVISMPVAATVQAEPETLASQAEVVVSLDQQVTSVVNTAGASVFTPTFSQIDPASLQNYTALMDSARQSALSALLEVIGSGNKGEDGFGREESLVLLWQGLHEVRGLARFIQASVSENLVAAMEDIAEFAMQNPDLVKEERASELVALVQTGLKTVWDIREFLSSQSSEEAYWQVSKNAYLDQMTKLENFKGKLTGQIRNQEAA